MTVDADVDVEKPDGVVSLKDEFKAFVDKNDVFAALYRKTLNLPMRYVTRSVALIDSRSIQLRPEACWSMPIQIFEIKN